MEELKAETERLCCLLFVNPPEVEFVDIGDDGQMVCVQHKFICLKDGKWTWGITTYPLPPVVLMGVIDAPNETEALYQIMRLVALGQIDRAMIMKEI